MEPAFFTAAAHWRLAQCACIYTLTIWVPTQGKGKNMSPDCSPHHYMKLALHQHSCIDTNDGEHVGLLDFFQAYKVRLGS